MNQRTCNNCGWVHFAVTRQYAEEQVIKFNEYFDKLPKKEQDDYYGGKKSSIRSYEHCFRCGGSHTNFRESQDGDCPDGCTMQPIIYESAGPLKS